MKFYSQITKFPNGIIRQVKDGNKIVSQEQLCIFINGELETENPELIRELQRRPDLFRIDHPWNEDPTTKVVKMEYKELVKLAKEKGIKAHGVKKAVLLKKLEEKGVVINA